MLKGCLGTAKRFGLDTGLTGLSRMCESVPMLPMHLLPTMYYIDVNHCKPKLILINPYKPLKKPHVTLQCSLVME